MSGFTLQRKRGRNGVPFLLQSLGTVIYHELKDNLTRVLLDIDPVDCNIKNLTKTVLKKMEENEFYLPMLLKTLLEY